MEGAEVGVRGDSSASRIVSGSFHGSLAASPGTPPPSLQSPGLLNWRNNR